MKRMRIRMSTMMTGMNERTLKKSTLADTRCHVDETLDDPEQIFLESWILALIFRIRTTSVQFLVNAIPSGSEILSPC